VVPIVAYFSPLAFKMQWRGMLQKEPFHPRYRFGLGSTESFGADQ
jgi:hypothetical protein